EAAIRELHEETGLQAAPLGYLTNVDFISTGPDGKPEVHYLLAAVLCRYQGGTPVAGDDAAAVAWVPFDDIAQGRLQMSERVPEVLAAALERLG
ncbi:MAG: NUDIX domain-containing protein, partial [Pseudomonadota bacterium]|nr:NUDIX domain-containing protein [Pseudomonadota bacterium]